ncbi:MAG: hypothetical protein LBM75_11430 [Myxococcales bacterium]|jgi:hypothetical protein|nr:hypothetical protein [Myxococcales bacterium]
MTSPPAGWLTRITLVAISILSLTAAAPPTEPLPLAPTPIPEALAGWTDWVLKDAERCPEIATPGTAGSITNACAWISELSLDLNQGGGTFAMRAELFGKSSVILPGSKSIWPNGVRVDGKATPVILRNERPTVFLDPGTHAIEGAFVWKAPPPELGIPPATALLALTLHGKRVAAPARLEATGALILQSTAEAMGPKNATARQAVKEKAIELTVHRKLVDELPLQLITRMNLEISGSQREERIGPVLPQGFIPMDLTSPLPARLGDDGFLTIQARPGQTTIVLTARLEHLERPTQVLSLPTTTDAAHWVEEEYWVFDARPNLRQVSVTGAQSIDPNQTALPSDWRTLAAYQMTPETRLELTEKHRGERDADATNDALSLSRIAWLDFDGKGFSVADTILGRLRQNRRLTSSPPLELGRAELVGRENLLLTRFKEKEDGAGVELRAGPLQLKTEGRQRRGSGERGLALGWDQTFQSVSVELNLPPGWRLLAATGLGSGFGQDTWLDEWSLLALFLLLFSAVAAAKLYGKLAGALTFVTMLLVIPESMGVVIVALLLLACEACLRLFGATKLRGLFAVLRWASRLALLLVVGNLCLEQLGPGVHPILEKPGYDFGRVGSIDRYGSGNGSRGGFRELFATSANALAEEAYEYDELAASPSSRSGLKGVFASSSNALGSSNQQSASEPKRTASQEALRLDPSAAAQTGMGLPHWHWRSHAIAFNGPVDGSSAQLRLWLVPPWLHRAFAFLRVLLCAALVVLFFGLMKRFTRTTQTGSTDPTQTPPSPKPKSAAAAASASLLALLFVALPTTALAQSENPKGAGPIPSQQLLDELRGRLLAKPACSPTCASLAKLDLALDATKSTMRAQLDIHAEAPATLALPGIDSLPFPTSAKLGSGKAALLRDDKGVLWAFVPQGIHTLVLEGPIPPRGSFQILLPEQPRQIAVEAKDFSIEGIQQDGQVRGALRVTHLSVKSVPNEPDRNRGDAPSAGAGDDSDGSLWSISHFPPVFEVERTVRLGLTWQVETTLRRLTPATESALIDVPLLSGEKVLTANAQIKNGRLQVNLPPHVQTYSWSSALDQTEALELRASADLPIFERWQLDIGRIWHVEFGGGVPMLAADGKLPKGEFSTELALFRPLPGESLALKITRPDAIDGPRLTLDELHLEVRPGDSQLEATLDLSFQASLGRQHPIRLPADAKLTSVEFNGQELSLRVETDGRMTLPITPGKTNVRVVWTQPSAPAFFYEMPEIDVGLPSVNVSTKVIVPRDRWILFAGGAPVGPVVRFWSLLAGMLLLAFVLGRFGRTKLGFGSWFLLLIGFAVISISIPTVLIMVGWFLFLAWRSRAPDLTDWKFNLRQIVIVLWTIAALITLIVAVGAGLLGEPDMQISGNASGSFTLNWFWDRSAASLRQPWFISVPMLAYKGAMLLWALWLALSLVSWLRWGFAAFGQGGLWKSDELPEAGKGPITDAMDATIEREKAGRAHDVGEEDELVTTTAIVTTTPVSEKAPTPESKDPKPTSGAPKKEDDPE